MTPSVCASADVRDGPLYRWHAARSPSSEWSGREINQTWLVRPLNPLWQREWWGLSKQGWQEETISKNSGCCLRQAWGFGSPGLVELSFVPSTAHSFIAGNSPAPPCFMPSLFTAKAGQSYLNKHQRCRMTAKVCKSSDAGAAHPLHHSRDSNSIPGTKSCNWKPLNLCIQVMTHMTAPLLTFHTDRALPVCKSTIITHLKSLDWCNSSVSLPRSDPTIERTSVCGSCWVHSFFSVVWIRRIIKCRDMKSLVSERSKPCLAETHILKGLRWKGETASYPVIAKS